MLMSRVQDPAFIAGFYEAAADSAGWGAAWAAVCRVFEAPAGLLFHQPDGEATPRILASMNCEGVDLPPYADALPQVVERAGAAIAGAGAFHILGASVPLGGSARAGVGLHRPIDAPAFGESDRAALDSVARHLAVALRFGAQIEAERVASAMRGAALDALRHGAVIVTGGGTVVFYNHAAVRMADDGGLVLEDEGGQVTCEVPEDAARLAALIRDAADGGQGGCTRITRSGRRAMLAAVVSPLAAGEELSSRPLVMVSVRDLGDPSDATETHLMDLFDLTAAEAGILPQLLAGDSAALIAQSRGVQVATIRTQAARVLAKTGAANLRALASMVAALG